jgi:hypothetical protein
VTIESEIAPTRSAAAATIAVVAIGCGLVTATQSSADRAGMLWQTAVAAFLCGMAIIQWFARKEVERWLLALCLLLPVVLMAVVKLFFPFMSILMVVIALLGRLLHLL